MPCLKQQRSHCQHRHILYLLTEMRVVVYCNKKDAAKPMTVNLPNILTNFQNNFLIAERELKFQRAYISFTA